MDDWDTDRGFGWEDEMERMGKKGRRAMKDAGRDAERLGRKGRRNLEDFGYGMEEMGRKGKHGMRDFEEGAHYMGRKAKEGMQDLGDEARGIRRKGKERLYDEDELETAGWGTDRPRGLMGDLGHRVERSSRSSRAGLEDVGHRFERGMEKVGKKGKDIVEGAGEGLERGGEWLGRGMERAGSALRSPRQRRRDQERNLLQASERRQLERIKGDMDIVCIDQTKESQKALKYAAKHTPKDHTIILMHGIYTPLGSRPEDTEYEMQKLGKKKIDRICSKYGRECVWQHLPYSSNRDFGEKVCNIAEAKSASSVILGRRSHTSNLKRALLGTESLHVMRECSAPVTIVTMDKKKEGAYSMGL